MAFLSRIAKLIGLGPYQWPEGEPLLSGSFRYGTRRHDGTTIYAPGVTLTPLPTFDARLEPHLVAIREHLSAIENHLTSMVREQKLRDAGARGSVA